MKVITLMKLTIGYRVCKQGNRVIIIDGICKGEKPLGELLLEIAADRINKKFY